MHDGSEQSENSSFALFSIDWSNYFCMRVRTDLTADSGNSIVFLFLKTEEEGVSPVGDSGQTEFRKAYAEWKRSSYQQKCMHEDACTDKVNYGFEKR
jgi:hypothetical protein